MKQVVSSSVIEPLESRGLFAATLLDPSFGAGGVATLRLRGVSDSDQLGGVAAGTSDGRTYVYVRTNKSYQLLRLTTDGKLDTSFAAYKGNVLVFPDGKGGNSGTIAADSADRVLLFNGGRVIRFDTAGHLDTAFGGGAVALPDFSGIADISVDAADRVYVTGSTTAGNGVLVERLISRGRLDRTFSGDGKAIVAVAAGVKSATAQGRLVRAFDNGTPTDFSDDTVMIAADTYIATGTRRGVEIARLTAAGALDTSYGTGGVFAWLGDALTDQTQDTVRVAGIRPTGSIDLYDYVQRDVGSDVTYYRVDKHGVIGEVDETQSYQAYAANPFGGFVASNAYGTNEFDSSDTLLGPARGALATLSPSYIDADDRAIVTLNNGRARLNVARFLPSALPSGT